MLEFLGALSPRTLVQPRWNPGALRISEDPDTITNPKP